jgi:hypothetical protein
MTTLWLTLLVTAVALLGVGTLLWQRTRSKRGSNSEIIALAETLQSQPPKSPLTQVSFDQALGSSALTDAIGEYSRKRFAYDLGLDPGNIVIQGVSFAKGRESLTVSYEFSKRGMRLWKAGKAVIPLDKHTGYALPVLSDKKTGEFIELAKGRKLDLSKFAQLSSILVSTAHVISNMDIVNRLEQIDRKLDVLVQGREIDQRAKLERIYQMARERLAGELRLEDYEDMRRWRGELYELRAIWREELYNAVRSAPNPEGWLQIKWAQNRRGEKTREHLLPTVKTLLLTKVALVTDLCLAEATGTIDGFVLQTVADEEKMWARVKNDLLKLADQMTCDLGPGKDVRLLAEAASTYTNVLQGLSFNGSQPEAE